MAGEQARPAEIVVVSASHRSSTVELRERLFIEERAVPGVLADLADRGVPQCLVISTCDRVEIQASHTAPDAAIGLMTALLAERAGAGAGTMRDQLYTLVGAAAVRHVFAVAASLDSVVVGEPQVLGQVKASHRAAISAGTLGPDLQAVLDAGYAAAKRIRSETAIALGPVTLATSAISVARDIHGDISRCSGLLIGNSEMGTLMLEHFAQAGLGRMAVAAATEPRAAAMGRRHGCRGVTYDSLETALGDADIIIAAAGAGQHLIDTRKIEAALAKRRRRPIFLIDAAVPGDIEPGVERLDDAFCYDLDDLESLAKEGRYGREDAARQAWQLLDAHVARFLAARAERNIAPAVVRLQRHFEAARDDVLAKVHGEGAEQATKLLINKLLNGPFRALRDAAADDGDRRATEAALTRLFGLDDCGGSRRGQEDGE